MICLHCMQGSVATGGVCPVCRHPDEDKTRPPHALPWRYELRERYIIGKVVGSGGFGITYFAYDTRNRKKVAVKELFPKTAAQPERTPDNSLVICEGQNDFFRVMTLRFRNEAETLAHLNNHPEFPDVYGILHANGTLYYIMEALDGKDLKRIMADRSGAPIPWQSLCDVIKPIFRALDCIHQKGMLHRDISPDNIFVMNAGGAKLIDFGSIRSYVSQEEMTTNIMHQQYAAPEQLPQGGLMNGGELVPQMTYTDIYSLSVVLYYILTGVKVPPAFQRFINPQVILRAPNEVNSAVPPYVSAAIYRGVQMNPADRWQNVRDYAAALFPGEDIFRANITRPQTRMFRLVCTRGAFPGQACPIRPGLRLTIGRMSDNSIAIPDKQISRYHCELQGTPDGKLYLRDLGSANHTYLNGQPLPPGNWYQLKFGDAIRLGESQFLEIQ